jgi:hypothetical protein
MSNNLATACNKYFAVWQLAVRGEIITRLSGLAHPLRNQGGNSMNANLTLSFLALSSLAMAPGLTLAGQDDAKKSDSARTLTGCLSSGDKSGEYDLRAEDGSTWELHSKTAKLGDHVGHTVTVTGKVWHPNMHGAKEKVKDETNPNNNEHGHLNVTDVSMVSSSCK